MKTVILTLLVTGLLWSVIHFLIRWQSSRIATRLVKDGLDPRNRPAKAQSKLAPESGFIVHLSEEAIVCERPDGQTERLAWDDFQRVEILTTADGPFAPDAFWVLSRTACGCIIPWGATGERELLERLQRLPRFDNMAVINCSSQTETALTLCWQKCT